MMDYPKNNSGNQPTIRFQSSLLGAVALAGVGCSSEMSSTVVDYPEANTEAGALYLTKCGHCHVAPSPGLHTERGWFTAVQRMQVRMRSQGVPPLDKAELGVVLDYLQRHAGRRGNTSGAQ